MTLDIARHEVWKDWLYSEAWRIGSAGAISQQIFGAVAPDFFTQTRWVTVQAPIERYPF